MKIYSYSILTSIDQNNYFLLFFLSFFFLTLSLESEFSFNIHYALAEQKEPPIIITTINDNCDKTRGERMNTIMMGWDQNKWVTINIFKQYTNNRDLNTAHPNENYPLNTYWYALRQICGSDGGEVQSLQEVQTYAPVIKSRGGSFIGYNIEKDLTPINEVNDPIGSMVKACDIARQNGLKCLLAPSKALTTQHLNDILKNAHPEIYVIQGQSLQNDRIAYYQFVKPILQKIETFDSSIITLSQVSTQRVGTTVAKMAAAYDIIDNYSDGVNIWYGTSQSQKNMLKQFVQWFDRRY